MTGSNFNTPPTSVDGCSNDRLGGNVPVMVALADGTLPANTPTGNGLTVATACSNGAHEHGKAKHST